MQQKRTVKIVILLLIALALLVAFMAWPKTERTSSLGPPQTQVLMQPKVLPQAPTSTEQLQSFHGPTGPPHIKGPTGPPPNY